jgi:hypothetical protein
MTPRQRPCRHAASRPPGSCPANRADQPFTSWRSGPACPAGAPVMSAKTVCRCPPQSGFLAALLAARSVADPRIKSRAQSWSRPSESVRPFGVIRPSSPGWSYAVRVSATMVPAQSRGNQDARIRRSAHGDLDGRPSSPPLVIGVRRDPAGGGAHQPSSTVTVRGLPGSLALAKPWRVGHSWAFVPNAPSDAIDN